MLFILNFFFLMQFIWLNHTLMNRKFKYKAHMNSWYGLGIYFIDVKIFWFIKILILDWNDFYHHNRLYPMCFFCRCRPIMLRLILKFFLENFDYIGVYLLKFGKPDLEFVTQTFKFIKLHLKGHLRSLFFFLQN